MGGVILKVAFKYKSEVSDAQRQKVFDDMLALKGVCKIDGKTYIVVSSTSSLI